MLSSFLIDNFIVDMHPHFVNATFNYLVSKLKKMLEQQLGGKKEGLFIVPPSPLFLLGQSCYDLQTIKILCVHTTSVHVSLY